MFSRLADAMRSALAYTSARILLFAAATGVLYLVGARGLLLLALALLVSGIVSFVVLSRQRDAMSAAISGRISGFRSRADTFRSRIDAGASVEDDDGA
jgi:Mn2+/Fe2+ NRAMP family transporter